MYSEQLVSNLFSKCFFEKNTCKFLQGADPCGYKGQVDYATPVHGLVPSNYVTFICGLLSAFNMFERLKVGEGATFFHFRVL